MELSAAFQVGVSALGATVWRSVGGMDRVFASTCCPRSGRGLSSIDGLMPRLTEPRAAIQIRVCACGAIVQCTVRETVDAKQKLLRWM